MNAKKPTAEIPAERKHYSGINGLRAFSAVGIMLMHVLANGGYKLDGFVFSQLIPSFTNLVFLFMVISGFALCCGYYDKLLNNQITVGQFYSKRYAKIWPFFAMLCLLDLIISPSKTAFYEVFANLTLLFGLLPDPNLSVIGVGWFLGLIFVFYLAFPFFCYLLSDRRRAWFSFAVALVFSSLCESHFAVGRTNFLYSGVFFLAGGLIFLYRAPLEHFSQKFRWPLLAVCAAAAAGYYYLGASVPMLLVLSSLLLIYAMGITGQGILHNPLTRFLSDISMEFYLSHMVIYRVLEKLDLLKLFGNGLLSYLFASVCTLAGTILFAVTAKWGLGKAGTLLRQLKQRMSNPKNNKGE